MSRQIVLNLKLKEAYIIKHGLRDKIRDDAEEKLFQYVSKVIGQFRQEKGI